jgi:hypothetical protein
MSAMRRSSILTLVLLAIVLTSGAAFTAKESQVPVSPNVGFVLYTKSLAPGTLNARWMYANKYSGPGIATGGPREGFTGRYHVRYFYDSGEFSDEYDLVIEKNGDAYAVSWFTDGQLGAVGVGMEVDGGLAVGWRRVND